MYSYFSLHPLNHSELRFLYEIEGKINGFGFQTDPRIQEILNARNLVEDICNILKCNKDQVSSDQEEALNGNIIYHKGDLKLGTLATTENLKLPRIISGNLYLNSLTDVEGLGLPESIGGSLYLVSLPMILMV